MNSQQFLFINFLVFLALALFFVFGRSKAKQPTRLNLKATSADKGEEKNETERIAEAKDVSRPEAVDAIDVTPVKSGSAIYFVYNGHEWDAYEVLGLPQGASLPTATSHYQNLIKTADPSTFEFYDAAYSSILKTKS